MLSLWVYKNKQKINFVVVYFLLPFSTGVTCLLEPQYTLFFFSSKFSLLWRMASHLFKQASHLYKEFHKSSPVRIERNARHILTVLPLWFTAGLPFIKDVMVNVLKDAIVYCIQERRHCWELGIIQYRKPNKVDFLLVVGSSRYFNND